MLPLCTGSDTGGSLRKPATYCGVAAIRPTAGVVASDRRMVGLSNYSVQGPMARTISDLGMMLSAMAGGDNIDPLSYPERKSVVKGKSVSGRVDTCGRRIFKKKKNTK